MRIFRSLLAFAVVVGAFGVPAALAPGTASAAAVRAVTAEETTEPLAVTLVPAASGVIRPGEDLTLNVSVANRGTGSLPAGIATVRLDLAAVEDRADLADWFAEADPDDAERGGDVAQVATPELFPGQAAALPPIVIPAAALGLTAESEFGARTVSVRVTAGDVPGSARSSITMDPGTGYTPAALAVALPLTVPAATTGLIPAELLASYTATGGVLYRQLDEAFGRPIALGIDPRILASIRILGDAAPESAVSWLERLESAPNITFPLTYADTDIAATSQAGAGVLSPLEFPIDPALFAPAVDGQDPDASPSPTATPDDQLEPTLPTRETLLEFDYTRTDIAWPRDATVVTGDLDTFAAAELGTTILSSDNTTGPAEESGDVSGGAAAAVGDHAAVISDSTISGLLRAAVSASSDADWEAAMAALTASLATVSAEVGPGEAGEPRTLLATTARSWPLGGFRLAQTLAALAATPWAPPADLGTAISPGSDPVDREVLDSPVDAERLGSIQNLLASEAAAAQFSTVMVDPADVTGERRLSLLALAGEAWVNDAEWPTAVQEYLDTTTAIMSSVQLVDSSTITVLADNAELPITISNDLDHPVTVYVTVQPQKALLAVLDTRVEVTIEANSQRRASIPVQSVANGEVAIVISLTSAPGVPISQPTVVVINVQAGWETAATAVLGVLLVLVFAAGVIRTVRRRKRIREDAEAADDSPTPPTDSAGTPPSTEEHVQP